LIFKNTYSLFSGSSASDVIFQAYLLEGLMRWNEDRAGAALEGGVPGPQTYDACLRYAVNNLGDFVLGKKISPTFTVPRKYTGELIGVEYLYRQTGEVLEDIDTDPVAELPPGTEPPPTTTLTLVDENGQDEGFEEDREDPTLPPIEGTSKRKVATPRRASTPRLDVATTPPPSCETIAPKHKQYRPLLPIHDEDSIPCK
jgi:hypothetical protein